MDFRNLFYMYSSILYNSVRDNISRTFCYHDSIRNSYSNADTPSISIGNMNSHWS